MCQLNTGTNIKIALYQTACQRVVPFFFFFLSSLALSENQAHKNGKRRQHLVPQSQGQLGFAS